ncbi:Kynureninase (L-kynurenine hydrolase) [Microbotryomycetes sp. JL221]|nr:Kynureninase (L-kynurenine hydrolase) [Microbotryomycetes sp. JL221]
MTQPQQASTSSAHSQRLAQRLADSGAKNIHDRAVAAHADKQDALKDFRQLYTFPTRKRVRPMHTREQAAPGDDDTAAYFAGNSLGLMPNQTPQLIKEELDVWAKAGVLGHHDHEHGREWTEVDGMVQETMARVVGAKTAEVAAMGTLTANLHALFSSFYRPNAQRHKIMFEGKAFPSDQYAFASQAAVNGFTEESLLRVYPREGEFNIRTEDILRLIEEQGDSIAIICFGAIQFYSGEWFDMETITKAGRAKGCLVAWDCAHAAGNVPLKLHDWGVDFACWCTYKYMNTGPGGIAGIFVHERWADKKRLAGWYGHNRETRFQMPNDFDPMPGAAGWQVSNPSVLDMISLISSLELFKKAGDVDVSSDSAVTVNGSGKAHILSALRQKSIDMTVYLEAMLQSNPCYVPQDQLSSSDSNDVRFTIITPSDPARRGAQLSLLFHPVESMDPIFEWMREKGVLGDERRPGVIRLAPVPMYNNWDDCWRAATALDEAIKNYKSSQK